jgi:porin
MDLHTKIRHTIAVMALSVAAVPSSALAQSADTPSTDSSAETKPEKETVWARDTLTGDWGGLRTDLSKHGIDIGLRLTQYGQRVTSGGVEENGEYGGTMDYRLNFDGAKLFGSWDGFSISMHARTRWGEDIHQAAGNLTLANTGMLMPLPGDYSDTDVTGLLANQTFPLGKEHTGLASIGKIDIVDAVSLFFPSVDYGQEGFMNINALVTAMPWFGAVNGLSLYGGWLASINNEYQIGETAVLVTGTENVTTTWGEVSDSFDDVWVAAFHRFLWKMDDKPGYFMVFAAGSTREQPSNEPRDFMEVPGQGIVSTDEDKPWNVAFYLEQDLWHAGGDPNRKTTILSGVTLGPDNPQFAHYSAFTSVESYGPIASRPHDRMGASVWYTWMSNDFVNLVSVQEDLQDTYGLELYYNVAINKWMRLSADLQLIETVHDEDDLAVIPGVRLTVDF